MHGLNTAKTHIIVANASEARYYETTHVGQNMKLIKTLSHPESREKGVDLTSDRPGRYHSRTADGHGAYENRTPPKEVEAEHFAHEIAHMINEAVAAHQFDKLIVIAPPHFHGLLDKYFNAHVLAKMAHRIEKDYTKTPEKKLLAFLSELSK